MKEQRKELTEEVNEIIQSRFEFINRNYIAVRDAYCNHYDWPELDPLRHEISLCIIFGLCQAAITLTNHLLESLLKYALIIFEGNKKNQTEEKIKGKVVASLVDKYKEGINLYGNANLDETINRACTVGLINKEQKKRLHEFRNKFRNAYGHSDKMRTFGENTIPVTGIMSENKNIILDEIGEPKIAEFLLGQGLVQAMIAQNDAPGYFLFIDKLVRDVRVKLF